MIHLIKYIIVASDFSPRVQLEISFVSELICRGLPVEACSFLLSLAGIEKGMRESIDLDTRHV